MIVKNILRKTIGFFYPNLLKSKNRKKIVENTAKYWGETLRRNNMEFNEISFVCIITAGDYTNIFFEDMKFSIENHKTLNREYEKQFTWNKPHLHFELIITDKKKYIGAVVYPYEYFDSPKLLWLFGLDKTIDEIFVKKLKI